MSINTNPLPVTPSGLFSDVVHYNDVPRFMYRHVHRTVAAYIEEKMVAKGWPKRVASGSQPVSNFGAAPVTYQEIQPDENGKSVVANAIAITPGDEGDDVLQEMGGGYWEVLIPFFFDCYGEDQSISKSMASDVKSLITRGTVLPLYDWTTGTPVVVPESYIEFTDVFGPERPPVAQAAAEGFRRFWHVVKAEAHIFYVPASAASV